MFNERNAGRKPIITDEQINEIEIKERELIKAEDLSKGQLYPWE